MAFAESTVLVSFQLINRDLVVFYSDEHPLTLGIHSVTVINSAGASNTTQFGFSSFQGTSPLCASNLNVGTTVLSGDFSGADTSTCTSSVNCARPMYPALFFTDITDNPSNTDGDWQFYGSPHIPDQVCGVWKGASRTVDHRTSPPTITVTPDADPSFPQNKWNLGTTQFNTSGLPAGEWGSIATWNVDDIGLIPYHSYRFQVMVHDGDQNQVGGDAGEACINFYIPPNPTIIYTTANTAPSVTPASSLPLAVASYPPSTSTSPTTIGLAVSFSIVGTAVVAAAVGLVYYYRSKIKTKLEPIKGRITNLIHSVHTNPLYQDKGTASSNLLYEPQTTA